MKRWVMTLIMKKHLFLPIIITGLISCQPSPQAEAVHPPLPEVDIYAAYPQRQMDVSDLAEVVYIPLPKKLFLENSSYHSTFRGCISENLIASRTLASGDVEVFDHTGKKIGGFNRQGNSEEEYSYLFDMYMDNDRQEIWVEYNCRQFKVYTFDGTFKRNITFPEQLNAQVFTEYSRDSLLCYDDNLVENGQNTNPTPFYLLSKEDGGVRKITSVRVSQRLNNNECFVLNLGSIQQLVRFLLSTLPMQVCNGKAVLADYAQDTVFIYQNEKTTPLFVRKPSVFASLPFILTSVNFLTDRFLFFSFHEKANSKDAFNRSLMYDFADGKTYRYQLQNLDFEPVLNVRIDSYKNYYPSNWMVNEITVDRFLKYHREGKLKGKASEIATQIKSTDTSVLIIYKFHNKKTI